VALKCNRVDSDAPVHTEITGQLAGDAAREKRLTLALSLLKVVRIV